MNCPHAHDSVPPLKQGQSSRAIISEATA